MSFPLEQGNPITAENGKPEGVNKKELNIVFGEIGNFDHNLLELSVEGYKD